MEKGFSYLGGKTWNQITRDERTFCADLYMVLQNKDKLRSFTDWLIKQCDLGSMDTENEIEIGFEVTFLRDVLFEYELSVGQKVPGKKRIKGPLKRTLDLAIFLPNDIIIIEAKAAESLTTKQMKDFEKDESSIRALMNALKRESPNVHLVGLVSPEYTPSKETLNRFKNRIFTWQQIENAGIDYRMPKELGEIYSNKATIRRSSTTEVGELIGLVDQIEDLYAAGN